MLLITKSEIHDFLATLLFSYLDTNVDFKTNSLQSAGIKITDLTQIEMSFDDFLDLSVLDFKSTNLYRLNLHEFVDYIYGEYTKLKPKADAEEDLALKMQDLLYEPNDQMTRDTIGDRIFSYILDTLSVEDVTTPEEIQKNNADFEVDVLGKKFRIHVGADVSALPYRTLRTRIS